MSSLKTFLSIATCALLCISSSVARTLQQETRQVPATSKSITIIVEEQNVRFALPSVAQEVRLEVFSQTGELIYDQLVFSSATSFPGLCRT